MSRYSPPVVAVALCWALVACICWMAMAHTGGMFVYPLDDTYIHMTVARTLALHHTWGIQPGKFASASSSPGWTLLLAVLDLVIGDRLLTPLVLNLLFAAVLLCVADSGLRTLAPGVSALARGAFLLVLVLFTPLPDLVMVGMEHTAQTLSVFLLVLSAVRTLAIPPAEPVGRRERAILLGSAFFAGAVRYEAVFAVLPVCLLLLLRRRFGLAVLVGVASALTPAGFGLYSHHVSGFWLPFSVMAKVAIGHISGWGRIVHAPFRPVPLILALAWLMRSRFHPFWESTQVLLLLVLSIVAEHWLYGSTGWLARYESYAVALALFALAVVFCRLPAVSTLLELFRRGPFLQKGLAVGFVLVLPWLAVKLWNRTQLGGVSMAAQSCANRFQEHILMARFIRRFYDHDTVVLNDIGAVAYYTNADILDLAGLGSAEPMHALAQGHRLRPVEAAQWAERKHATIAVLQNQWPYIISVLPPSWTQVASINMPDNVAFGDTQFSFYAVDPQAQERLCANVAAFPVHAPDSMTILPAACPGKVAPPPLPASR